MRIVWRASVWSFLASLLGALGWAGLAATVGRVIPPFGPPASLTRFLVEIPWVFLGSLYWALFIAAGAFPCYAVLFFFWLRCVERKPFLDSTTRRRGIAALVFAIPPAILLAQGSGSSTVAPFKWATALMVFALALTSGWLGVYGGSALATRVTRSFGALQHNER